MRRSLLTVTLAALAASALLASRTVGASITTLGSASFAAPHGEGWGTAHPAKIYNGGDPSGLVKEIQWTSWGGRTATGYGLGWIFKPGGGYYGRPVLVELRAQGLGHCGSQPAYTQLAVRAPEKPEASLGAWQLWSDAKTLCHADY